MEYVFKSMGSITIVFLVNVLGKKAINFQNLPVILYNMVEKLMDVFFWLTTKYYLFVLFYHYKDHVLMLVEHRFIYL